MNVPLTTVGNKDERELFHDVYKHYTTASEDLDARKPDWDKKDELFRSFIDEKNWPYRAQVFDPRIFTALYEKTARLLANKPRGRMNPREGGDALGAKINNELLSFQWDDNERADGSPMLAKWALMDLNARKYGASFGLCTWLWERSGDKVFYDGPNFKPWENRDVLHNPSYATIKKWIQLRSYSTFQELKDVNDAARGKPIYKNLDLLAKQIKEKSTQGGDRRDSNYVSKDKIIKNLQDYLGTDDLYKTIELITEYRPDRWITFSRKHGVILRDIPNPYNHGQIPVVQLKYYPIDSDIYGLSEIEPVEKLQRATNALVCQYLDAINMSLYTPLKVNQTGGAVQMHTLQFGPGAKWLMNNPQTDVVPYEGQASGVTEFASTYRFMIGAMQEALGDTSVGVSNLNPGADGKTATEIKDSAMSRSARDNFNRIFLEEAIKKQHMFWFAMNQQLLFSAGEEQKIIRVAGKDAIRYFQQAGLDGQGLSDENIDMLSDPTLSNSVMPSDLEQPLFPVERDGQTIPKFVMEQDGQSGSLVVEPDDLSGHYDYVPDVGSMSDTADQEEILAKKQAIELLLGNAVVGQMLMQEGKKIKSADLLIDYFEDIGFKNADQYFENFNPMEGGLPNGQSQVEQGGGGNAAPGVPGSPVAGVGGMAGGGAPVPYGQNQPVLS